MQIFTNVTAELLQKFFPDVPSDELRRQREINLLISQREGQLAPQRIRAVGDLVLWDGPLGKTIGGAHPKLFDQPVVSVHLSKTHFARSMRRAAVKYEELSGIPEQPPASIQVTDLQVPHNAGAHRDFLEWRKWDSIGAACRGCLCGNCQPGLKEMTLAEERELEVMRQGLTYVTENSHSKKPHWHARYPWLEDAISLPNNKGIVEATFLKKKSS